MGVLLQILVVVLFVLAVAWVVALGWSGIRSEPTELRDVAAAWGMTEDDVADLIEIEQRVADSAPQQLMVAHLSNVRNRKVPVRAFRPSPVRGVARLCFADGTTLLVRGTHAGDLGRLAVTALTEPMWLDSYAKVAIDRDVTLDLSWPDGQARVLAVGLDQSD